MYRNFSLDKLSVVLCEGLSASAGFLASCLSQVGTNREEERKKREGEEDRESCWKETSSAAAGANSTTFPAHSLRIYTTYYTCGERKMKIVFLEAATYLFFLAAFERGGGGGWLGGPLFLKGRPIISICSVICSRSSSCFNVSKLTVADRKLCTSLD